MFDDIKVNDKKSSTIKPAENFSLNPQLNFNVNTTPKIDTNTSIPITTLSTDNNKFNPHQKIIIDFDEEYQEDKELLDLLEGKINTKNYPKTKPNCEIIPEEDEDKPIIKPKFIKKKQIYRISIDAISNCNPNTDVNIRENHHFISSSNNIPNAIKDRLSFIYIPKEKKNLKRFLTIPNRRLNIERNNESPSTCELTNTQSIEEGTKELFNGNVRYDNVPKVSLSIKRHNFHMNNNNLWKSLNINEQSNSNSSGNNKNKLKINKNYIAIIKNKLSGNFNGISERNKNVPKIKIDREMQTSKFVDKILGKIYFNNNVSENQ